MNPGDAPPTTTTPNVITQLCKSIILTGLTGNAIRGLGSVLTKQLIELFDTSK